MLKLLLFIIGSMWGGIFIGFLEGLYRQVNLFYSMFLYGFFWALLALFSGIIFFLIFDKKKDHLFYKITFLGGGVFLSLPTSLFVLSSFIIRRDFFYESHYSILKSVLISIFIMGISTFLLYIFDQKIIRSFLKNKSFHVCILSLICLFICSIPIWFENDFIIQKKHQQKISKRGKGVILIVVDTLRKDALGVYNPHVKTTKAIDKFAQKGRVFKDMSAQASWTKPAMASIMTSTYPYYHQTISKNSILPNSLKTISSELQKNNIKTAAVVTNYNLEPSFGFKKGFDIFHYLSPKRYLRATKKANRLALYNIYRFLRENFLPNLRESQYFYSSGTKVNRVGMNILQEIKDQDFFLWLHYMEPHDPYFSKKGESFARVSDPYPPPHFANRMKKAYMDDVERFDLIFDSLLKELESQGFLENTTLILTSDHGEEFYEHKGYYHGTTLYEEQLALPLIISSKNISAGINTKLSRQIDIAPTIMGLFNKKSPLSWQGRDLLSNTPSSNITMASENHQGHILESIRRKNESDKLITANENNPRGLKKLEYYNLENDPQEKNNLPSRKKQKLYELLIKNKKISHVSKKEHEIDIDAEAELRSLGYIR